MRLEIQAVSKRYAKVQALRDLSLTIEPGQVIALLGANGAGKTTLLRCLATLVVPDNGKILCDGERLKRGRIDLRRRLAFLPDFPPLFPEMTVVQHIGMVLRVYGFETGEPERVAEVLDGFDMLPLVKAPVARLSRGQSYKAALTAMLVADPELWMFDEPFASGMDPAGIAYFRDECHRATKRGRTIIYSTQILDIAENFCDRVCVIDRGRSVVFASIPELRQEHQVDRGVLDSLFASLRERR
ncbi:MAG: ABC transporter ATP-binding protein [Candidatus Koribacter versatilis]|uniref:ABC transporter ATP-binding protein n=1 Tax=Candidatus Korobacter versatilis TaxID=658062 RepID=A0A932A7E2_9BACT|nr:ABC transporter ATP-binding protein [Candidatus Koribacter versatilis]